MPFTIVQIAARASFFINFDGPNPPPTKTERGYDITAELVDAENDRLVIELYNPEDDEHSTVYFKIDPTAPATERLTLDDTYSHADFASDAVDFLNTDLTDTAGNPIQIPRLAWRLFLPLDECKEEVTWFINTVSGLDFGYTPLDTRVQQEKNTFITLDPIVKIIDVRSCVATDLS